MQYLYLLKAGESHYKIGIASNVRSRAHELQRHNPERIDVVVSKIVDAPYDAEQEIHKTLEAMKADGANEWFRLTPEQAIEVAITINQYPDIDVSEQATLNGIVREQQRMLKAIEKRLDTIVNNYQRGLIKLPDAQHKLGRLEADEGHDTRQLERESADQEMYALAKAAVIDANKASTSLLQRRLRIGYGRAARIIEQLEEDGIIGPEDGSRPRRVNVPEDAA